MIETPSPPPAEPLQDDPLAQAIEKLKTAQLGARKDLKISRHLFRGEPSYIIHDPVNFQSHRFSHSDYIVLSALDREKTIDEVYQSLVQLNQIKDEPRKFYEFILGLQMRGLLDLPILDSQRLYKRFKEKEAFKNKKSLMKMIFIKIPLFNPNAFLDRTVHLAKPLFSKAFFVAFLLLLLGAIGLLFNRWEDFYSPFASLLATRNLIILAVVMTALKFWHELGHAYACKVYGGAVPDMGAFLMAGMPMAYVDVSSSWSFSSRNQRIMVALGGMYFEGIAAALAMYVWAFTSPGLINSTAHFVVLMASFMTLLFNANPLMRYDGYYILSDMTGIPNLRGRSTQYAGGLLKYLTLGIPMKTRGRSVREMAWMLVYGVAAVIYQSWLMLTIAFMIAGQFFLVGMTIGAIFLYGTIVTPVKKIISYLWYSQETEPVRERAYMLSGALILTLLALVTIIPVPGGIVSSGQLTHENIQSIRLPFDCVIREIKANPDQKVAQSQVVMQVESSDVEERFLLASAQKRVADRMMMATASLSPAERKSSLMNQSRALQSVKTAESLRDQQTIVANTDSTVLSIPSTHLIGSYVKQGEELGRLGSGARIVRVLLPERDVSSARIQVGDSACIRVVDSSSGSLRGKVQRVEPAGNNLIQMKGLTHEAGGEVITGSNGFTETAYFIVDVSFDDQKQLDLPENTTAYVKFGRRYEPLGFYGLRHLRIFTNKLFAN